MTRAERFVKRLTLFFLTPMMFAVPAATYLARPQRASAKPQPQPPAMCRLELDCDTVQVFFDECTNFCTGSCLIECLDADCTDNPCQQCYTAINVYTVNAMGTITGWVDGNCIDCFLGCGQTGEHCPQGSTVMKWDMTTLQVGFVYKVIYSAGIGDCDNGDDFCTASVEVDMRIAGNAHEVQTVPPDKEAAKLEARVAAKLRAEAKAKKTP